jgi:hypothetical protein
MIEATCHCGAVRIEVALAPETVTDCNCSICRRIGVLWAYYTPEQLRLPDADTTDIYIWGRKNLEFHRCKVCGVVSHWAHIDRSYHRIGVNARLMDPAVLAAAQLRHLDAA